MCKINPSLATKQDNALEILNLSCWEIIDIAHSQHVLLEEHIQRYNESLPPSKIISDTLGRTREYFAGKLRAPQTALAQKLIWLAMTQAEETRRAAVAGDLVARQKYMLYYDENADSIPVTTNRGELRRLLGKKNGLASMWRHLNELQDARIILSKANTSRKRREVVTKDGHTTIIVEIAENGRGDFTLWISRAVFKQKLILARELGKTEKRPLENLQISKLEQLYPEKKETKKEEENNPAKQCEEGVASPHGKLIEAIASDDEKRDEDPKNEFGGGTAAAGKKSAKILRPAGMVLPLKTQEPFSLERYNRDMRRNDRIRALIPGDPMAYWVFVLYHQLVEMLYPHLSEQHLAVIADQVKGLLELHIRRIEIANCKTKEEHIQKAACRVSRAIYLAHIWMKGKDFRIYEPLTYLRLDDGMKNGLRDAVDKWLPAEDKRRALRAEANSSLMRWQKAEAFAEDLFRDVMFTLKASGYYQSSAVFEEAQRKLNKKFDQIGLSDATRTKVRDSFSAKCLNVFHAIQKATFEEEDTTWNDFLRYRKSL